MFNSPRRWLAAAALSLSMALPAAVQAHTVNLTAMLNLTDPASNGQAIGESLFTGILDTHTGSLRFKVDVLKPLSGFKDFTPGVTSNVVHTAHDAHNAAENPNDPNAFTIHLHGSVGVLKKDGKPQFSCTGLDCLTEPRNPLPNQGPQSAATQLWSFHNIHSGEWIEIANIFSGGDTNQRGKPGSLSKIGNLSKQTRRDLGLTRLDDVLLGFWYVHTQTDDNNRVRGFISPVLDGAHGHSPDTSAVPIPGAAWLLMSALSAMGVFRRRVA
ncbi:MAG: VPLPA-CTERM sorting domain-containing protein [Gammaproteobacteria bacterium]